MPLVLLVDDDPAMLKLLEVNFRLEGYRTRTAGRGEDALAAVAAERPDALVLDVTLPGLDGHEVYRRLREDPATRGLPVVFLSGRALSEERNAYAGEGVAYLTKPFDPIELVGAVRTLIGGAS